MLTGPPPKFHGPRDILLNIAGRRIEGSEGNYSNYWRATEWLRQTHVAKPAGGGTEMYLLADTGKKEEEKEAPNPPPFRASVEVLSGPSDLSVPPPTAAQPPLAGLFARADPAEMCNGCGDLWPLRDDGTLDHVCEQREESA